MPGARMKCYPENKATCVLWDPVPDADCPACKPIEVFNSFGAMVSYMIPFLSRVTPRVVARERSKRTPYSLTIMKSQRAGLYFTGFELGIIMNV